MAIFWRLSHCLPVGSTLPLQRRRHAVGRASAAPRERQARHVHLGRQHVAMRRIGDEHRAPLRPADPYHRWRMRMLLRYLDNVIAPSLAMIASNRLAAPRFVGEDPAELRRRLDRIPLPERRATWAQLMFRSTPPADLAESERRVADALTRFDNALGRRVWIACDTFSLADIGIFASFYSLPATRPEQVNDAATPHLMRWLRACHGRPALQAALNMGKGSITQRAAEIREALGVPSVASA